MTILSLYLFLVISTSLWCTGLYIAGQDGMLLSSIRKYFGEESIFGKPLIGCLYCMASLHTGVVMLIAFGLLELEFPKWTYLIGLYLLSVPAVSVFNGYLFGMIVKSLEPSDEELEVEMFDSFIDETIITSN